MNLSGICFACIAVLAITGCETVPKPPPPKPVRITSLSVFTTVFEGRIEAYADVTGYLSTSVAQIVEPTQWRQGYRLYIELNEQTPPRTKGTGTQVAFQRRVPIEISGLAPGVYIINVNGKEEHLEIDGAGLRPAAERGAYH